MAPAIHALAAGSMAVTMGCSLETAEDGRTRAQRDAQSGARMARAPLVNKSGKADRSDLPSWAAVTPPRVQRRRKSARLTFSPRRETYPLARVHAALASIEAGRRRAPFTILHLGDSHIAADRMTQDLREMFQKRFGDAGRGLMMPGAPFAGYRAAGVSVSQKGPWRVANSVRRDPGPYGLTGMRLTSASRGAHLLYEARGRPFDRAEIVFAAGPDRGSAIIGSGRRQQKVDTAAAGGEKRFVLDGKVKSFSIRPAGGKPVSLLSVSLNRNGPGVRYVNLGIPSATADTTQRWSARQIADDLKALAPDLVILGYGVNEGFNDGLDIAAYEGRFRQLVSRIRAGAPQADLVILGAPDGARLPKFARKGAARHSCRALSNRETRNYARISGAHDRRLARWHPPPKLDAVRQAQKRVAARLGAHFWDWSKVMGGPCGIHAWANARPRLALGDHVHLTSEGARRSAKALFRDLMEGYRKGQRIASR